MKQVIVTLLAQKPSELSRFLKSYYEKEIIYEEGAYSWSCYFDKPKETVSLLSALMDNNDSFQIQPILSLDKNTTFRVTDKNIEDLIKILIWI